MITYRHKYKTTHGNDEYKNIHTYTHTHSHLFIYIISYFYYFCHLKLFDKEKKRTMKKMISNWKKENT